MEKVIEALIKKAGEVADSKHPLLKVGLWIVGLIAIGFAISFAVGWLKSRRSG